MTDEKYKGFDFDPRIDISFDEKNHTLTIADSGIGMNDQDLVEHLGTIARSGTKSFLEKLSGDAKKDSGLIGQFGVGFYSCFMISDKVEVTTRKAGEDKAWKWTSDGKTGYEISEAERSSNGTTVFLFLNEEGKEYANRWSLETIIKKYSDHIPFPIYLHYEGVRYEGEDKDRKEIREPKVDQVNAASAFWKRSKSDLKDEDYNEFYKTFTHDYDDPMLHMHTQAEGTLDYTTLFFIPKKAPMDLFRADYKAGVKLYVKRVFITDDEKELLPTYLRFVRGVIDSEDLPLNVSREILQQNKILSKIRTNSVKKILSELETLAKDEAKYGEFYAEFGRPVKEGLYQDFENRETLLSLVRFKTTAKEGFTSFADYVQRMKPDQKAIYFITGTNEAALRNSPLLEMYRKKEIEVLIMDDEIDEIVIPGVGKYKDFDLKAVNRSDAADDLKTEDDKKEEKDAEPLIERIKKVLGDKVKDVKASVRLSDSPACVTADSKDPTAQMQALMKAMGQGMGDIKPILEINPGHPIIKKMTSMSDGESFNDACLVLLEQSLLIEGVALSNPADFVKRLNALMEKAL
jgi:molecular chaperone HtpG